MAVQNGAYTRTNDFGPDVGRVHARFHMEENPPIDPIASEKEGRPVHLQPREMIELIMEFIYYLPFANGVDADATGVHFENWALKGLG